MEGGDTGWNAEVRHPSNGQGFASTPEFSGKPVEGGDTGWNIK